MILKIWRLYDAQSGIQVNFEKDLVIGFAAIDLSILAAGFPEVSGWFHILDFTGTCNGQIKINIRPLENISSFSKFTTVQENMQRNTNELPVESSLNDNGDSHPNECIQQQ